MKVLKTFDKMVRKMKSIHKNIYMIVGGASSQQYRNLNSIKKTVKKIADKIPEGSIILYFGDPSNKKKPDIGYAFGLLMGHKKDKNWNVLMIQIEYAKTWYNFKEEHKYIDYVFWHNDVSPKVKNKWAAYDENGDLHSNTKKWVELHQKYPFTKMYVIGGGPITLKELILANKHDISYEYFKEERKYNGDGKTLVTNKMTCNERYGPVYEYLCELCQNDVIYCKKCKKKIRTKKTKENVNN